jgi:hypothetical protein
MAQTLEKDDVLFFDGTHLLYPNSDVMWFFLEILPNLKKGVVVHLHDVYLPYDYPDFMLKRYYNEQYVLATLLLNNPEKYEILSPNYFIYSDKALHHLLDPIWELEALKNVEQHGGSSGYGLDLKSGEYRPMLTTPCLFVDRRHSKKP